MENAISAALSKQIVLARALDVAANNIANQTTAGYRAERLNFNQYVSFLPAGAPTGDRAVSLVYDADSFTDFSAGGLRATGAPLDFAIDGDGFFAIESAVGPAYTRNGAFGLNDFGELVTRSGDFVLSDNGAPIVIDPEEGELTVSTEGELQQNDRIIARLGVFAFEDPRVLRRAADAVFTTDASPRAVENARVRQGFVENSNVDPIRSMTSMVEILRAYESAAQVLETANTLSRNAVRTLTEDA